MNKLADAARAWEKAGLENDFIFSKVMTDPQICLTVIQSILPALQITRVTPPQSQQEINPGNDVKGVRYDIYTQDEHNNHYDIEMQVVDHQRVRYYQAMCVLNAYDKGANYRDANNSYVIFICCFDPFQKGAQFYSVNKHLNEFPEVKLLDGATDIYLNANSLRHEVPPKLQVFLDLIAHRQSRQNDHFRLELSQKIKQIKGNKKWRADFMRLSLSEMDHQYELREAKRTGINEGIDVGIDQERCKLIKGLKQQGQSKKTNIILLDHCHGIIPK